MYDDKDALLALQEWEVESLYKQNQALLARIDRLLKMVERLQSNSQVQEKPAMRITLGEKYRQSQK